MNSYNYKSPCRCPEESAPIESLQSYFGISVPTLPASGFWIDQSSGSTDFEFPIVIEPKLLANGIWRYDFDLLFSAVSFAVPHDDKEVTVKVDFVQSVIGVEQSTTILDIVSEQLMGQSASYDFVSSVVLSSNADAFLLRVTLDLATASTNAFLWATLVSSTLTKIG